MAATRLIAMHQNKGRSVQQCLKDRTDYAKNAEKTEGGELVSSYACNPETVEEDFALTKREYDHMTGRRYSGDIIAYQIRQSFKPGEITAEEANRIGYETAMRWTKGQHAFIVATHVDKAHIHNHIIYNSTSLDCGHRFRDFFFSGIALQKVSDLVCLENGLSVIEPKKPGERQKRSAYADQKSHREKIREAIDACMQKKPKDMEELLKYMEEMGYVIKRGKYIAVKNEEMKKFLRFRSLGAGYREEDLYELFAGDKKGAETPDAERKDDKAKEPGLDMLLDIQKIIAKGKGPGYERWAGLHNTKTVAKTLLFLQEHDIRGFADLDSKAKEASERFAEIRKRQKALEARLAEITALKEHIFNYSKTREIYAQYRKSGYSKKFFEEHREEITIHKAAKDAFSKIEGNIPKIKDLNEEYGRVLKEKKETYAEYRKARDEMKEYQTAKYNIDHFYKRDEQEKQKNKKNKNRTL